MTSPRLVARQGALLVVDVQEKLLEKIADRERLVANAARLVDAARALGMPVLATEQYPKGLGPTTPILAERLPERLPKTDFHCCGAPGLLDRLHGRAGQHVTLTGIEADAVGSRGRLDWEFALRRLEHAGAVVSTTEAALFEWTGSSEHPAFKAISALVKALAPADSHPPLDRP